MTKKKPPQKGSLKHNRADYSTIYEDFNKFNHELELFNSYCFAMKFFRDLEQRLRNEAQWYFNYMRKMEFKAHKRIDEADRAYENYGHYIDLIAIACRKNPNLIKRREGGSHNE